MNPEQQQYQTLQQYFDTLIRKQQPSQQQTETHKQLIEQFHNINKSIQNKLQHYSKLFSTYIGKVQNSFIISFTKVLQKMGNDLMLAQQAYKSIDKEIMANQRCVSLTQDKLFFINQSNYYQQQFNFKSKEVEKLKQKNFLLIKENSGLKEKLFEKIKEIMFYKQKCKKLEKLTSKYQTQQNQPQKHNLKGQVQDSPSKFSVTGRFNKLEQKKWASYGRQTQQQKRLKQEQRQKDKKNLLVNIRKQLKTRQRLNLDQIVYRNVVPIQQSKETKSWPLKKVDFSQRKQCYTERVFRNSLTKGLNEQNRSMFNSTVASNLQSQKIQEVETK